VVARSKARNVFARSNIGIVRLNRGIDTVWVSSVFVLSGVGSGLATGLIPVQGVLPTVYKIHSSILILMGYGPEGLIRNVEEILVII
jgi:hypothetical protein